MTISRILATGVMTATVVLGGAGVAQAAAPAAKPAPVAKPGQLRYPDGNVWLYGDINYGGWRCGSGGNVRNYRDVQSCNGGNTINDKTSSVWNNGHPGYLDDIRLYEHADYQGYSICLTQGVAWGNLHNIDWGDRISSHKWANSCP